MSQAQPTSQPATPNPRPSRPSPLTIVVALILGLAGVYATLQLNATAHPAAAFILAIITALTAFKLVVDLSRML
jgi:hypothetical protein